MNLLVRKNSALKFVLGEFSQQYESVGELIEHHQKNPIKVEGKPGILLTEGVEEITEVEL